MNLPPEYVEVDKTGVRVYPVPWKRIIYITLNGFIGLVLIFLWMFFISFLYQGKTINIFFESILIISLPVISILILDVVYHFIGASFRKLPIMEMDANSVFFPHLRGAQIPWSNLSDVSIKRVIVFTTQAFTTQKSLKVRLDPPLRVFPVLWEKIRSLGKARQIITIPVLFGWPCEAETLRDLLLLGQQTWAGNRQIPSSSPTARKSRSSDP